MLGNFGRWLCRRPWLADAGSEAGFQVLKWRALRKASIEVLLFLAFTIVNPFDLVGWSEQRSHDLLQIASAGAYPGPSSELGRHSSTDAAAMKARDYITLLYFDDPSVARQFGARAPNSSDLLQLLTDISYAADPDLVVAPDTHFYNFAKGRAPAAILLDFDLQYAAPADPTGPEEHATPAGPAGPDERGLFKDANLYRADTGDLVSTCRTGPVDRQSPPSPFRCLVTGISAITHYPAWRQDSHCQDNSLAKLACIRDAGGVPIIIADGTNGQALEEGAKQSPAFAVLAKIAVLAPAKVGVTEYPLVQYTEPDHPDSRFSLTPSAALYAAWCYAGYCAMPPRPDPQRYEWPALFRPNLEVRWAVGAPPPKPIGAESQLRYGAPYCVSRGLLAWLAREAVHGLLTADERPPCPYTKAAPFDILQTALTASQAQDLTAGKLVLIGGQFAGSPDMVAAAPYGSMPGVYLHAMALDNLMEFGSAYPLPPKELIGGLKVEHWPVVAAIFLGALVIFLAIPLLEPGHHDAKPGPADHLPGAGGGVYGSNGDDGDQPPGSKTTKTSDGLRRAMIAAIAFLLIAAIYLVILSASGSFWPKSYNVIEGVTFTLLRFVELIWAAFYPLRETIKHAVGRAWRALWSRAPTQNAEPTIPHGDAT